MRVEHIDKLLSLIGGLACEPWPSADLYLHGDKREAVAIPRSTFKRLIAIYDEIRAADEG